MFVGQRSCDFPSSKWKSKVRLLWFYLTGVSILWISTPATVLDLTGNLDFGSLERTLFYFSLLIWLGMYGYIGYLVGDGKLKHILLSMVLAWFTSIMNTFPISGLLLVSTLVHRQRKMHTFGI